MKLKIILTLTLLTTLCSSGESGSSSAKESTLEEPCRNEATETINRSCVDGTGLEKSIRTCNKSSWSSWSKWDDSECVKCVDLLSDEKLEWFKDSMFPARSSLTKTQLCGFNELSIWGVTHMSEIPKGAFDVLYKLENLSLHNNTTRYLPEGVFDGLTNLKTLDIFNNDELVQLPRGAFDKLTKLEVLEVYGDNLYISSKAFDKLTNLKKLGISPGRMYRLPDGIFDKLTKLEFLYIGNTGIYSLSDDIFDNLTNLTTLDLRENNLSTLPSGIFDNLTKLERLQLDRNNISSLPEGIFSELSNIVFLSLTYQWFTVGFSVEYYFGEIPSSLTYFWYTNTHISCDYSFCRYY